MMMAVGERIYRVVAAVETLPQGWVFTSLETPRLAALVGSGYLVDETPRNVVIERVREVSTPAESVPIAVAAREPEEVAAAVTEPPKRRSAAVDSTATRRRIRKEQ